MTYPQRYDLYEEWDGDHSIQTWDDGTYVLYTDWNDLAKALADARYALATFSQYKVASDAMKAIDKALNGQRPASDKCAFDNTDHIELEHRDAP